MFVIQSVLLTDYLIAPKIDVFNPYGLNNEPSIVGAYFLKCFQK